ncbi:tetratricopeptide repeat-containing sensor histidine kinase [Microscilla marina]|uniref:histidine kinase n=1 Tax=Microscilla marina ATCC 23134 TaxID=313606 RepID=A1ZRB0_MICM2|nr:tetratricopeptide repeat-containing sensor histidine kinase [Microscilla marina]EAY27000.1 tetratricopeptide repeat domain protein [Microscilla marina ATCC 23134]
MHKFHLIIIYCLWSLLNFSQVAYAQPKNAKADSLNHLLNTKLSDKQRVDVLLKLINTYIIKYPEKAYQHCKKALDISLRIGYDKGVARSYDRLGLYYKHANDFEKGLSYHLKGLKIYEKMNDQRGIASSLGNIGVVHKNLKNYDKAFEYQLRALKLMKALKQEGMVANTLNNIGLLYLKTDRYKKALEYFKETLKLDQKTNYALGIGGDYSNISLVWYYLKDYDKAIANEKKALKIREKIKHAQGMVISYHNIGDIYLETQQYDLALEHFKKSLAKAKKIKAKFHIAKAYNGLSKAYEARRNYKKALEFHQKFKAHNDSVFNLDKNKQVARMQTLYETEKKEQENKILRQESQMQEDEIAKQRLLNLLVSIALLITLGFIYMVYRLYRQKKKSFQQLQQLNEEVNTQNEVLQQKQEEILQQQETLSMQNAAITEQKEEIELQTETLQATNKQLIALDKFKQSMTGMIVHDLKNPLNTIIGLSEGEYSPHFQQNINQSGKQMLNLVMNILDVQRFEETEVQLNAQPHLLKKLVQTAHQRVNLLLADKGVVFESDIPQELTLQADEELIIRVFVNLFNNAIKYTPNGGKISVTRESLSEGAFHKILIHDTGAGIAPEFIDTIFDRFTQRNPKNRSTGLGLTFCKLVVESHQGQIGVQSEENKGSTFWLTLPKADDQQRLHTTIDQTDQVESDTVNIKAWELNTQEEAVLREITNELKQYEIYEVSAIKKVLKKLPASEGRIAHWKQALEDTLYSWNETRYKELLEVPD